MNSIPVIDSFKVSRKILLFLLCNLNLSCATKELSGNLITLPQKTKYEFDFDFSHPEKVREQIRKIGQLNNPDNQQKLIQILVAFTSLNKNIEDSNIKLLSHSKTQIYLNSFCAVSGRAAPEENEVFRWVKGYPDIQLIREVTTLFNKDPSLGKSQIQEIIWNLENKTYFEDYPDNLKRILVQASHHAKLILPSQIKSRVADELMPDDIKQALDIVEGQYHTLEDFKKRIDSIKSKNILPKNYNASTLPSTHLTASTTSSGYSTQNITLYNSTNKDQILKITDYYLMPVRSDVQPIILASILPYNDEIKKILEDAALKMLGYIGSQYPTLNADEKDLVKKRPIESAIAFYNAIVAEQRGESAYPKSKPNGESDALRHFAWAALLTRDIGEDKAYIFLHAHETTLGQSPAEKSMDDFNNKQGISSANALLKNSRFSNDEIFEFGKKQISDGKLKVLNPTEVHR